MKTDKHFEEYSALATLPLRDVVVYPHMVLPLFVGRPKSIAALDLAMDNDEPVFLLAQRNPNDEEPNAKDLHEMGTVAHVLQVLKLPDGTVKVLVEGVRRARALTVEDTGELFLAHVEAINDTDGDSADIEALRRTLLSQFDQFAKLNKKIPGEVLNTIHGIDNNGRLVDTIAAHLQLKLDQRQEILDTVSIAARMEYLLGQLEAELDIMQVEKRIRGRVKRQMEKSQREYYLNEQVKAIQKELGEEDERGELDALEKQIKEAGMSKEAEEKSLAELKKLKMMPPMSAESTVVRNYIDTLLELPWKKKSRVSKDIAKADLVLDADHYGLEKVKERILEYLAVQKRVDKLKGPILCLVGPPGVGKTSLAASIARAIGRKFVRASLGGVRDEAEIRGHRRTYVGALPGRILEGIKSAESKNPVFLLDEIDKMSNDFRGDPSAALLEVLDPEQNNTFSDHYVELPFDLSKVLWIVTANSLGNIPRPLRDRMEIIMLPSYTEDEKQQIAERYLIAKQREANGLKAAQVQFSKGTVQRIIAEYTRESGVRELERLIAKVCRKAARRIVDQEKKCIRITPANLEYFLGKPKFLPRRRKKEAEVGVCTGMAWTEVGGDILPTEVSILKGKGKLILTGQLGEVMQESAQAGLSYIRSRAEKLHIDETFYEKQDIHIHLPEGAIPKDGPSAGITMATAMVSALTNRKIRSDVAMTGEITLRGRVLPIGGLKEKVIAAYREGITTVILPKENERDIEDIAPAIKEKIEFVPVENMDEVLDCALVK